MNDSIMGDILRTHKVNHDPKIIDLLVHISEILSRIQAIADGIESLDDQTKQMLRQKIMWGDGNGSTKTGLMLAAIAVDNRGHPAGNKDGLVYHLDSIYDMLNLPRQHLEVIKEFGSNQKYLAQESDLDDDDIGEEILLSNDALRDCGPLLIDFLAASIKNRKKG